MADWIVSGAGDGNYNGSYTAAGTHNGKPYYTKAAPVRYLFWEGTHWYVDNALAISGTGYQSAAVADLPANPWTTEEFGIPPAPTVSAGEPGDGGPFWTPRGDSYTPGGDERVETVRAYVWREKPLFGSESYQAQAAIYLASSGALMAVSEEITLSGSTTPTWEEFGFTWPELANGVEYAVMIACNDSYMLLGYDAGGPGDGFVDGAGTTYNYLWPEPMSLAPVALVHWIEVVAGTPTGEVTLGRGLGEMSCGQATLARGLFGMGAAQIGRGLFVTGEAQIARGVFGRGEAQLARGLAVLGTATIGRGLGGSPQGSATLSRGLMAEVAGSAQIGRGLGAEISGSAQFARGLGTAMSGEAQIGRGLGGGGNPVMTVLMLLGEAGRVKRG